METIGWIGSVLLAFCALPELIIAIRKKRSDLSWIFLLMWLVGEICLLIPIAINIKVGFLLFNYIANTIFIIIICYYKYKGEKNV